LKIRNYGQLSKLQRNIAVAAAAVAKRVEEAQFGKFGRAGHYVT